MAASSSNPIDLSLIIQPQDPIEAAILLTRTGKLLASWTRHDVPTEVVTVMAATLLGSIETMSIALGAPSPREVALIVDSRRLLSFKLNPDVAILVVASVQTSDTDLRAVATRIVRRLPPFPLGPPGTPSDPKKRR